MIPKIIHYCWFGKNPLPESVEKCIASWKALCPDYKIVRWDETNFDINVCDYTKEAYEAKKYAFVADYARLFALINEGGFYFDTDVELKKPLDSFLKYSAVSGFEEGNYLQTAVIGSEKGGEWVKYLFSYYEGKHFLREDGSLDTTTNVSTITKMTAKKYHLARTNRAQSLSCVEVFPIEYFSPKSFATGLIKETKNTVCVHHFDSTWTGKESHKRRMHNYKIYARYGETLGRKVLSFEEVTREKGFFSAVLRIFQKRRIDTGARRILLYGHTGSNNHGCEALVRTIPLAAESFEVSLISSRPEVDRSYNVPIERIVPWQNSIKEFSLRWFLYKGCEKVLHAEKLCRKLDTNKKILREMQSGYTGVFAIGGDNYCYNQGKPYHKLDADLHKSGVKNGILGCSFEPADMQRELGAHLQNFGLIAARESITYEAVKSTGHKNVFLVPDSAFLLPAEKKALPVGFREGKTIGLNFSPLSLAYAKDKEKAKEAIRAFLRYLIEHTDLQLAFISHVYKKGGADGELMRSLAEGLDETRVCFIHDEALNCMQIKGYIARCKYFIGARTHATIAAYSSLVPTLVLGYSVKSRGIARDLFGTEENYVLPIETLSSAEELIGAFTWLSEQETDIRKKLADIMPEYQEKVRKLDGILNSYLMNQGD